jgi:hypothetical protein
MRMKFPNCRSEVLSRLRNQETCVDYLDNPAIYVEKCCCYLFKVLDQSPVSDFRT